MSTPTPPQYAPFQSYPQPPAPKKRFNWKLALAMFAAVIIGGIIGSVSNPAPPPVVQVQEKRVEVEKKVTETPAECGTALDLGADIIGMSGTVVGLLSNSMEAVGNLDAATIRGNSAKIREQTAKLKAVTPDYQSARDTCKASLK